MVANVFWMFCVALFGILFFVVSPTSETGKNTLLGISFALVWILGAIGLCLESAKAEDERRNSTR